MEKLLIKGGKSLSGKISCSGAKNAALPMIAATILCDDKVVLKNLPYLQDITTMFELLGSMGSEILLDENMDFTISSANLKDIEARYELVKTMRASILVLGPLLSKYGKARIALPGGCAIGSRPVNFHLDALKQMGASITLRNGYIEANASKLKDKLRAAGAEIDYNEDSISINMKLEFPNPVDITTAPFPEFPTDMQAQFSVINAISTGTANIYETVFENRFMHILELNRMGCDISVKGNHAVIQGVKSIYGAQVMATDLSIPKRLN